jgi:two-component system, chemotaxis family, sensor kinase CheA
MSMDDLLREFLTETAENMGQIDVQLVQLEQNPNNPELLSSIFRLVHTIKGTCGFLGLPRLEKVAHAGENILGKFRDGELEVTPLAVTLILRSMDAIKYLLGELEATEKEPDGDDLALIADLNAMAEGRMQGEPAPPAAAAPDDFLMDFQPVMAPGAEPVPGSLPSPGAVADVAQPVPPAAALAAEPAQEIVAAPAAAVAKAAPAAGDGHDTKESSVANQSIRVNVSLLENLMTIVSELVLTRNQLLQIMRNQKESEFTTPLQRLNLVTSELQEGVMKTRMQPIGNAWSKLPRIIRDLTLELGKKIDLQMIGAETELDRQVLELIKDPLTHMVRNSADHGVEMPAERIKAGKSETGRIVLHAYHEGGHIIIEISDDGKGLALDRIKAKAIENGLATEAELASMPDQQIMQFIFKAGFSTAAKVTSVSGRGVGMDVVRTNIEKIGGTVDLQSTVGKGSRFLIKIPLTLAIVAALIVECAGERFAIPQISVVELVRTSAQNENKVEHINDTPVLRLRNRLLPLVSLRKLLKLPSGDMPQNEDCFVIVAQVGPTTFGIMVDRVFDTEEIVVKPVAPILRNITMFSGNTILGDGSVIMILDLNGVVAAAGDIQGVETQHQTIAANAHGKQDHKQALLLFKAGDGAPKAVPLALIARLEDVAMAGVEFSNRVPMVQYRGKLMPLVTTDANYEIRCTGNQPVLVFAESDRAMGLLVDEIVDIVEERLQVEISGSKPGLLGSAIIAGKATEVIDAGYYLTQAFSDWFGASEDAQTFEGSANNRVLLVDDSPFFRNLLTPLLHVAGYHVTTAENPAQALKLQESGADFDVIVSDIEMPGMNGFDFATEVRRAGRWQTVPMIALSSHATARDLEHGRQVGFNDYVAKFDRDGLLQTLQETLGGHAVDLSASVGGRA